MLEKTIENKLRQAVEAAGGLCLRHAQEGQHSHEQEAHTFRESFCHPATAWRSDELFVSRCHIIVFNLLFASLISTRVASTSPS